MAEYIHGFSKKEQEQLIVRAEIVESLIYAGVDLEDTSHLLEVGCGTGAQTAILARRYPRTRITGLDLSESQLAYAKKYLRSLIKAGRVQLRKANAGDFNYPEKYDAAFLCWFLEHVPNPLKVLKNVKRHLKPGSKIYLTEVLNLIFLNPYSPANLEYWNQFNDLQWSLKGHPFVGAELGNLLTHAGFKDIRTEMRAVHADSRNPQKKNQILEIVENLALTAAPQMIQEGRVSEQLILQMKKELRQIKEDPNGVLLYPFMRAVATV